MLRMPLEADATRSGSPIQRGTKSARKQTFGQLTKEPNVLRFDFQNLGYSHYVEENLNLFRRLQANLNM